MRNDNRLQHIAVLFTLLLATALIAGCDQAQVAQTGPDYEAKRLNTSVWATTDSSQPKNLLKLTDSVWHGLVGVRMVTTDNNGQAQIQGPKCAAVYLYQNSGLTMSTCPKGGGTGSCSSGTMVSKNCNVSISTMPADVKTVGTWFSVTYLEESRVTLVIVGEGAVAVTPATVLDFRLVDREQLQYEVFTRELGEEVQVEVVKNEPRFFYTASDDRLNELRAFGALPNARTWLGLEELPQVSQVLSQLDPNLELWLEQIRAQATQDGMQLSVPSVTLVSIEGGEPQPNLAQSWEVSEDGLSWTFFLDENRKMSDGTPYTSDIVQQVLNEQGPGRITGYAGSERINDYTIIILLETPNPDFLREVAQIELPQ